MYNFVVKTFSDATGKLVCYETVSTRDQALRIVKRYEGIKNIKTTVEENTNA